MLCHMKVLYLQFPLYLFYQNYLHNLSNLIKILKK